MSTMHQAILWSPGHDHVGFCDRLRGIAAGAVFAEELGLRLLVRWEPCEACPVDIREVFEESDHFLTRWEEDEVEIVREWNIELNVMPLDLSGKLADEMMPLEERIVLSDEEVLERWAKVLKALKPQAPIAARIERLRKRMNPSRMLGVHLRRTDVLVHGCKTICRENVGEHDAALWSRIVMAVANGEVDEIYLASDDQAYFERWKEKLGELPVRLHFNEATWGTSLRQTPLADLVIDLYLLSSCRRVYGTVWSSVFFVGEALGGNFEILDVPELPSGHEEKDEPCVEVAWSSTAEAGLVAGLVAVTVCVNYSDYLAGILENRKYFDEWIIVTAPQDLATQELCREEGLKCLVTEEFYRDGDSFNKARGLNLALREVKAGSWIVSLDSDLLLPRNFREELDREALDPNCLYGLQGRCVCPDPDTLEILKVSEPWDALARDQIPWPLGYFQLFHPENRFARRFDEKVSSNASAYDDQFARDFGPENWRYLPMTGVHLGEINLHWNGREEVGEETGWRVGKKRDPMAMILDDLLQPERGDLEVLQVSDGMSVPDREVDVIVLTSAVRGEDFHPLFRKMLPILREGGGIVAPFFEAAKWPEWTATLALRLGMPERVRPDGWCLIRPAVSEIRENFVAPRGWGLLPNDAGTILVPMTAGLMTKVSPALHSLRKFWSGRIALAVSADESGPWERIAASFQARLFKVKLPRPAEWNDQWGRELEKFSLVATKGLLRLTGEKVLVWHPEAICLGTPGRLFEEMKAGEIFFLYDHEQDEGDRNIANCMVPGSEEVLRSCEGCLIDGLRLPSFHPGEGKKESLFGVLSRGVERLVRRRYFRSVWDFENEEEVAGDLVGVVFSKDGESSGKLICEHWAENEDEVARRFACKVPVAEGTIIVVRIDADTLPALYFNFRLWKFPEEVPVHLYYSGLSEDDFFFLEDRAGLYLHDLNAGGEDGGNWNERVASLAESGKPVVISPKWKPRPGANLLWDCHAEAEVSFEEFSNLEALGWVIDECDERQKQDDLEARSYFARDEVAFITLSNGGYIDYTLNCLASLRKLGEEGERLAGKLTCYSVGRECHERMIAIGVDSVLIDDEAVSGRQSFRQGGWSELVKYKFDAISRELLESEFVCFTDGDIVFESTDFLEDCVARMHRGDLELLIQNDTSTNEDGDHSNLCSGFMMIRSTANTRRAFSFETILRVVNEKFSDQLYVNDVIKHEVRTGVLPLAAYPNGAFYQAFGATSEAKIYHFNYLLGDQKEEAMREGGKWHL